MAKKKKTTRKSSPKKSRSTRAPARGKKNAQSTSPSSRRDKRKSKAPRGNREPRGVSASKARKKKPVVAKPIPEFVRKRVYYTKAGTIAKRPHAKMRVGYVKVKNPKYSPYVAVPFLDGRVNKGLDPHFKKRVTIRDTLVDIQTKSPYLPNRNLGIEGRALTIEKRSIEFKKPLSRRGGKKPGKKFNDAFGEKLKELHRGSGNGIYYLKARLLKTVPGEEETASKWVSVPRRRVDDNSVRNSVFSFNTMLDEVTSNSLYGTDNGYGIAELEFERIGE